MAELSTNVMLQRLCGDRDTVPAIRAALGKTITSLGILENDDDDDVLAIGLEGGLTLTLWDNGQQCCETRYMQTDDDLQAHVGSQLTSIEVANAPNEYGDHEVQFLRVTTTHGMFTVANHNEHNGYYGGFYVVARLNP